uniref:Uncharacterized protein n=1 Tax=Anguilla anguilla TaxID=7936 RepID=A0A0E9U7M0_ANGAN
MKGKVFSVVRRYILKENCDAADNNLPRCKADTQSRSALAAFLNLCPLSK